jgi:1,4-dihydroxy-2-naphthoate octaprenyltransferase
MYLTALVVLAAETRAAAVSWDVALGAGSLVLFTGGLTAVVRRAMRPGQALGVLGLAIAVAAIAALASTFPSDFYRILIIGTTTVAGAAMAAAIVSRPLPRIR